MSPQPGTHVEARNAFGEVVQMVAVTGPQAGVDFPVVWLTSPEEYLRAQTEGAEPEAIPWPLDAVQVPESA